MDRRFSPIIEGGIYFLIVFSPLAFGAVYPWAFSVLELACFGLFFLWLLINGSVFRAHAPRKPKLEPSLTLPFAVFVGLILFQMMPMPPALVRTISPQTHSIYCETLDGYGSKTRNQESEVRSQTF